MSVANAGKDRRRLTGPGTRRILSDESSRGGLTMTRKTAAEVRDKLPENLASVEATGEPVAIESNGRTVAVIVSVEDFALLQRLREEQEEGDRIDVTAAKDSRKEPGSTPWEKIKADLGL